MDSIHVYRQEGEVIEKRLDYMAEQLTKMESTMIDPVQFGSLQNEVQRLRTDLDKLAASIESLGKSLDALNDALSQAKGGWRALAFIGGVGAAFGGFVSWAMQHIKVTP